MRSKFLFYDCRDLNAADRKARHQTCRPHLQPAFGRGVEICCARLKNERFLANGRDFEIKHLLPTTFQELGMRGYFSSSWCQIWINSGRMSVKRLRKSVLLFCTIWATALGSGRSRNLPMTSAEAFSNFA